MSTEKMPLIDAILECDSAGWLDIANDAALQVFKAGTMEMVQAAAAEIRRLQEVNRATLQLYEDLRKATKPRVEFEVIP